MKKSEGELLREYAKIISEAENEDDFNDEEDSEDEYGYDPNKDELALGDQAFRKEDEGEPEFNDLADNDNPISQLATYLNNLDPHEMTFSEAIQKFLHEHNLELTPKNGLINKQGAV